MISSSIRFSAGGFVDWMMNTSQPRMFSLYFTQISPSLNRLISHRPRSTSSSEAMLRASPGFDVPEKIFRECGMYAAFVKVIAYKYSQSGVIPQAEFRGFG